MLYFYVVCLPFSCWCHVVVIITLHFTVQIVNKLIIKSEMRDDNNNRMAQMVPTLQRCVVIKIVVANHPM